MGADMDIAVSTKLLGGLLMNLLSRPPEIIVCGLGRTGRLIFGLLRQQGVKVVGISAHPLTTLESGVIVGNLRAPDVLKSAGIQQAHTLVLACSDDPLNLAIMTQARLLNPKIRIINRLFNANLGELLDQTLPQHVSLSVAALAAPLFVFAALGSRAIGQITLFKATWPIYEEHIEANHPWCGKSLRNLWNERNRMLIHYQSGNTSTDLVSAVRQGVILQAGDRLIVATRPHPNPIENRRGLRLWQRVIRTFRQFGRRSRVTALVLLGLLITIGLATAAYISSSLDTHPVDALYFAVGMITGAGGQEEVAENASSLVKLFTVIMMLVGAGVIGICYALLNDFILGTHLQELWSVVRLPTQHHYIVCGLGGVGYSIATHFYHAGYNVVVIERDGNNRFLPAIRALKIPIILGDASLKSVLDTVNVSKSAALLAVTSDDTVNLEIALSTKGLAPRHTVVVRTQDADFAWQVQQVFEFEQVMSPLNLAAPAFAAAALGGRILGSSMIGNVLWVAIATLITPNHPFCGQSIRDIAKSTDLVPLYIESQGDALNGFDLLEADLDNGDVLYLTMPAHRLDQIWRTSSTLAL